MIISSANDYREAAKRRLPPFLFEYIDGGAYAEYTLKRNVDDLSKIALRQRVLNDMSELSLETQLFGENLALPVALSPVGLTGMYARRGEVQAAVAADKKGIPFTLSTVSVCPIEEVAPAIQRPMWFQLVLAATNKTSGTPICCAVVACNAENNALAEVSEPVRNTPTQPKNGEKNVKA